MFGRKKGLIDKIDKTRLPVHIGIIMDGNGRWAKKRGLPRNVGHTMGAKKFEEIIDFAGNLGIKVVTVYAFSTENWSRPADEVEALMELLQDYLDNGLKKLAGKDTRVRIIGDKSALSEKMRRGIENIESRTKDGKSMLVQIALNYGGRQEIVSAAKKLVKMAENGEISEGDVTAELMSGLMYSPDVADPDLIIRPSGEYRTSNFLLWESAYSELWFSDIMWPDFTGEDLLAAIYDYQKRNRRFGGV